MIWYQTLVGPLPDVLTSPAPQMRICRVCGEDKSVGEYYTRTYPNGKIVVRGECKACNHSASSSRRKAH